MANNSLTNLAVVRPKGPRIFAALAGVAAIAAVAWFIWFREPGPQGEPEHPLKVLLVGGDSQLTHDLRPWGFDLEQKELSALADQGTEDVGPAAALRWADLNGFGYVAFADPTSLSFDGIPVAGDSAQVGADARFAVFAVGDLGSKVTVDPGGRGFEVPPGVELLSALFEQDALAATLVGANKLSMNARPLFERIEEATLLKGKYGIAQAKANRWKKERPESIVDTEEADPKPLVLAESLERTRAIPLGNGGTLVFVERPRLLSPWDDVTLEYQGVVEPVYLPPGATSTEEALPCDALAALPRVVPDDFAWSRDKWSVVIEQSTGPALWRVGKDTSVCDISRVGVLAEDIDLGLGELGPDGRFAQSMLREDGFRIEVWTPGTDIPKFVVAPGCTQIGPPVWIDDDAVALKCGYIPALLPDEPEANPDAQVDAEDSDGDDEPVALTPQVWIYLVDLETSKFAAIKLDTPEPVFDISILPIGVPSATALLVDDGGATRTLISGSAEAGRATKLRSLITATPPQSELPRPPFADESEVVALDPTRIQTRELDLSATRGPVVASGTGTHLAFEVDGGGRLGTNVAVLELATGNMTRVGINQWAAHERPLFTFDGSKVSFSSTYRDDGEPVTVARLATVP